PAPGPKPPAPAPGPTPERDETLDRQFELRRKQLSRGYLPTLNWQYRTGILPKFYRNDFENTSNSGISDAELTLGVARRNNELQRIDADTMTSSEIQALINKSRMVFEMKDKDSKAILFPENEDDFDAEKIVKDLYKARAITNARIPIFYEDAKQSIPNLQDRLPISFSSDGDTSIYNLKYKDGERVALDLVFDQYGNILEVDDIKPPGESGGNDGEPDQEPVNPPPPEEGGPSATTYPFYGQVNDIGDLLRTRNQQLVTYRNMLTKDMPQCAEPSATLDMCRFQRSITSSPSINVDAVKEADRSLATFIDSSLEDFRRLLKPTPPALTTNLIKYAYQKQEEGSVVGEVLNSLMAFEIKSIPDSDERGGELKDLSSDNSLKLLSLGRALATFAPPNKLDAIIKAESVRLQFPPNEPYQLKELQAAQFPEQAEPIPGAQFPEQAPEFNRVISDKDDRILFTNVFFNEMGALFKPGGQPCERRSDCPQGQRCVNGVCTVMTAPDDPDETNPEVGPPFDNPGTGTGGGTTGGGNSGEQPPPPPDQRPETPRIECSAALVGLRAECPENYTCTSQGEGRPGLCLKTEFTEDDDIVPEYGLVPLTKQPEERRNEVMQSLKTALEITGASVGLGAIILGGLALAPETGGASVAATAAETAPLLARGGVIIASSRNLAQSFFSRMGAFFRNYVSPTGRAARLADETRKQIVSDILKKPGPSWPSGKKNYFREAIKEARPANSTYTPKETDAVVRAYDRNFGTKSSKELLDEWARESNNIQQTNLNFKDVGQQAQQVGRNLSRNINELAEKTPSQINLQLQQSKNELNTILKNTSGTQEGAEGARIDKLINEIDRLNATLGRNETKEMAVSGSIDMGGREKSVLLGDWDGQGRLAINWLQ
ncbi:MAG: hypothetical protein CL512_06110, partial [Actinobacteria bacterium]|nr:hypothetical protein [Actinomycetota bacterium]